MVIASGVIDRGHLSPFGGPPAADSSSSFFSEDLVVPPERQQVGFWKSESMVVQRGSKSVFASPLEKIHPMEANSEGGVEHSGGQGFKGLDILRVGKLMGQGNGSTSPSISWGDMIMTPGSREASGTSRIMVTGQSADTLGFICEGDEPLGSMEEVEAQTIGDLLPTDDDLISGVVDDFDFAGLSINHDDADEDIFGSGGGMELENDDSIAKCAKNLEGSFKCQFSGPQNLSSPIRIEPLRQYNNQAAISELGRSLGKGHIGLGMQMFHPHSLPECGVCNVSKLMTSGGRNAGFRSDRVDYGHLQKVGSGSHHGHSFDQNNEGIGVAGVGSFPLHRHHYSWNNSNAFPQSPSSPMMWPNVQHPVRMYDYPGAPPHALNTGDYPMDQHHIGSAPNNRGGFGNVHLPGSLGSVGFPVSPRLSPSDLAVFPPARGNYRETIFSPVGAEFPSLQQMCRGMNGRNPMVQVSASYDATNDRMRSRRHDGNNVQPEIKRQFELDIELIAKGEDSRTTLMIKNIPNKYNCKLLLAVIDENHRGTYDFVYLPIDFKNKCNVGYVFINMTDPQHIIPFYKTFNGKRWEKFNSEKVASLAYARIQGRSDLISHFRNSSLMNEDKWCRPILFHKDGPNAGDQEPFPVGNSIRPRTGRNRPLHNSGTRGGDASLSTSPNQENSGCRANAVEG